jgi:parallel beta-helix repeat protein
MKTTTLIVLLLTCSVVLVSLPQIGTVKAEDTIYIKSDGSVDGTELLQRNNNTYTFLNDISGNIVVSKDFITIDGSGYSLKGSGDSSQRGINLSFRKNVTVTNLVIMDYFIGISCKPEDGTTTNITILNNYIRDCGIGIEFLGASNNLIKYNTFKNNDIDISINYVSGNNLITHNNLDSYIQVWMSDRPTIDMNYWTDYNGTDNDGDGIGDSAYFYHDILQDSHPLTEPVPAIPEFPSWVPLLIMLVVVIAVAVVYRCKLNKPNGGRSRW